MQRYFGISKTDNRLILEESDYHHIKNVMRNSDGDLIEVVVEGVASTIEKQYVKLLS